MFTFPVSFISSKQSVVDISYLGYSSSTADTSTYTFSSQSFGDAASDRVITVTIGSIALATRTISSVTIGGVTATNNATAIHPGGSGESTVAAIFSAIVPTGTTGDIVVTFSSTMLVCGIGKYRTTGSSATEFDSAIDTTLSGSSLSTQIDVESGGCIIGCSFNLLSSGTSSVSWTGITEDYEQSIENVSNDASGAHDSFASSQSDVTITATFGGGTSTLQAMATASFSPT